MHPPKNHAVSAYEYSYHKHWQILTIINSHITFINIHDCVKHMRHKHHQLLPLHLNTTKCLKRPGSYFGQTQWLNEQLKIYLKFTLFFLITSWPNFKNPKGKQTVSTQRLVKGTIFTVLFLIFLFENPSVH